MQIHFHTEKECYFIFGSQAPATDYGRMSNMSGHVKSGQHVHLNQVT